MASPAPAQLQFVSSLFTSKIFWTQVITLIAMVLSASGVHVIDAPGVQEQLVGTLDVVFTVIFRLTGANGPVSLGAPLNTPAPVDVPPGASVVTVPTPSATLQATVVQPLADGVHTVDATTEIPIVTPTRPN